MLAAVEGRDRRAVHAGDGAADGGGAARRGVAIASQMAGEWQPSCGSGWRRCRRRRPSRICGPTLRRQLEAAALIEAGEPGRA